MKQREGARETKVQYVLSKNGRKVKSVEMLTVKFVLTHCTVEIRSAERERKTSLMNSVDVYIVPCSSENESSTEAKCPEGEKIIDQTSSMLSADELQTQIHCMLQNKTEKVNVCRILHDKIKFVLRREAT